MRLHAAVAAAVAVGMATIGSADTAPPVRTLPVAAEKPKCKSYVETGSLARMRKECHTRADWERLNWEGQRTAASFVGQIQGGSHVNDDPSGP